LTVYPDDVRFKASERSEGYRQDKVTDMARRTSSELTGDEKTKDEFLLATKDRRIFPEA
jgi:hypothetical protein